MFRRLFRLEARTPEQVSREMRDEIDAHIALGVEHLVARGVSREEARAKMQARFGSAGQLPVLERSALHRATTARRRETLRTIGRDLVFAWRQAKRAPLFSLGIVLSLGFGIGATAVVYSWMQGLVLRPLPVVRDLDRLISVRPDASHGWSTSLPDFEEWRKQSRTTSGMTAVSLSLFALDAGAAGDNALATPIYGMFVSATYFDVLGVPAAQGRLFNSADDVAGAEPVVVISDYAWRTQLGADPHAIGRTVRVNARAARIIGITPPFFGGNLSAARFDLFVPVASRPLLVPTDADQWNRRDWQWVDVIARLKPGMSVAQADEDFKTIAARQAAAYREDADRGARAIPLDMGNGEALGPLFLALTTLTLLVVLLICSNVANLLLTRATTRDRELAVRLSLGASRSRVIAQLMIESCALAFAGALLGFLLSLGGDGALGQLVPRTSIRLVTQSEMDWRFLLVVIGVTGGSVLTFGLAPAILGSRVAVVEALKNGARGTSESRTPLRNALVVSQFAFALAILVAGALFFKRDRDVRHLDLGFEADSVLLVQTEVALAGHKDFARWGKTMEDVVATARSIPGVRSAAIGSFVPLGLVGYWRNSIRVPGDPSSTGIPDLQYVNSVSPDYFDVMRIRILAGRPITDADVPGAPLAAVVNEAFVHKYFAGRQALGAMIEVSDRDHVIVGIAHNVRFDYRVLENAEIPMVYFAWKQVPMPVASIHLRTVGDPMAWSPALLAAINEVDPKLPTLPPVSLADYAALPFSISRSIVKVAGTLSTVALLLATMGLFSVVSYGVSLRTREIGIRMALGATSRSVIGMFLGGAAQLIAYGCIAGIIAATGLTIAMRIALPLLPNGTAAEFLGPVLILGASALAAGFIPSLRAATVDPARTLRSE